MSDTTRKVTWQSPSNIALVKYWGKRHEQIPMNASISLTLSEAHTTTSIVATPNQGDQQIDFLFHGVRNEKFGERVARFVRRAGERHPSLAGYNLEIHSENSFPHSAGIASSASAMSALALGLCSISDEVDEDSPDFTREASYLSRLGSGSAARSVAGPVTVWGKHPAVPNSSDDHAVVVDVHPIFSSFRDSILLIDQGEKSVKSSAGHALMNDHPYAEQRFDRAGRNLSAILEAMRSGDLWKFGEIVESEALDLHAMMMTSSPAYLLMRANTIRAIEKLYQFREKTKTPVFFTLDAGPNLHVLYPEYTAQEVGEWIESEMAELCQDRRVMYDQVSSGPVRKQDSL